MNDRDRAVLDLAVSGLLVDGGHHKQYYLTEIARLVTDCPDGDRGPLDEILAAEDTFFEDVAVPEEVERHGEYWVAETGVPG